ncbi:MAG: hypothetical protein ACK5E3_01480 [Planctomycetota bacterium]
MNRKFLWIASVCFACYCHVPPALALVQDPSPAPVSTEPTATVPAAQEPVAANADEPKTDQTEKRLKSIEKLLEAMSGELKARKDAESARKSEEMKKADEKKSDALPDVVTTPRPRPERQSPPR